MSTDYKVVKFEKPAKTKEKVTMNKSTGSGDGKKKMWRIEGKDFEQVKFFSDALTELKKRTKIEYEELHKKMWDAVSQSCPETKGKQNIRLDAEYADLGFYIVKEVNMSDGGPQDFLKILTMILND